MSLGWLFRFSDRTHPLALPILVALVGGALYTVLWIGTEGGFVRAGLAERRIIGTLCLFVLLVSYLLAMVEVQRRRTEETLRALAPMAPESAVARVHERIQSIPRLGWLGIALGAAFGLNQNPEFIGQIAETGQVHPLDVAFIAGACGLWTLIGFLLGWRIPTSIALSRLGGQLRLDLYRMDRLRPLARVSTSDVLVVAGALALTPLQSIDAEFRFGNYRAAALVGPPAAILLFLLPLWGAHRLIQRTKAERLAELRALLDAADRKNVAELESLTSHIDRVQSIPGWPVDLDVATRVFSYLIIPPVAWVAAALVERLIERL